MKKIKSWLANSLLICSSFLISIALVELFLQFFPVESIPVRGIQNVDSDDITFIPNSFARYSTNEFEYSITANKYGRRDKNWSTQNFKDTKNIIFVGDSFVMGAGVNEEYTIPTLLETYYKEAGFEKEIFNFGIGGNIALPQYKLLLQQALNLDIHAKTIIIGIFIGNDFSLQSNAVDKRNESNYDRKENKSLISWLKSTKIYKLIRNSVSSSPILIGYLLKISDWTGLNLYDSSVSYLFLRNQSAENSKFFMSQLTLMKDIRDIAHNNARNIFFVIFPNKIQVENFESLTTSYFKADKPNELITLFCKENNLKCLDLLPILKSITVNDRLKLYYPKDRHFTAKGSQISARSVFKFLQSHE